MHQWNSAECFYVTLEYVDQGDQGETDNSINNSMQMEIDSDKQNDSDDESKNDDDICNEGAYSSTVVSSTKDASLFENHTMAQEM